MRAELDSGEIDAAIAAFRIPFVRILTCYQPRFRKAVVVK